MAMSILLLSISIVKFSQNFTHCLTLLYYFTSPNSVKLKQGSHLALCRAVIYIFNLLLFSSHFSCGFTFIVMVYIILVVHIHHSHFSCVHINLMAHICVVVHIIIIIHLSVVVFQFCYGLHLSHGSHFS